MWAAAGDDDVPPILLWMCHILSEYATDIQGMHGLISRETTINAFLGLRHAFRTFGINDVDGLSRRLQVEAVAGGTNVQPRGYISPAEQAVSYTHLRAHETGAYL
eukprot:7642074-Pyramimonas_sp.AAC.1